MPLYKIVDWNFWLVFLAVLNLVHNSEKQYEWKKKPESSQLGTVLSWPGFLTPLPHQWWTPSLPTVTLSSLLASTFILSIIVLSKFFHHMVAIVIFLLSRLHSPTFNWQYFISYYVISINFKSFLHLTERERRKRWVRSQRSTRIPVPVKPNQSTRKVEREGVQEDPSLQTTAPVVQEGMCSSRVGVSLLNFYKGQREAILLLYLDWWMCAG